MNLVLIALGVVLMGLLGYLAYSQTTSLNKKISAISSSVVELQTQVKGLQKQLNNNVSFGTEQSLDALIHQIESEIDNETGQIQDAPTDMPVSDSTANLPTISEDENNDMYAELESELAQEFDIQEGGTNEGQGDNNNNVEHVISGSDQVDVEEMSDEHHSNDVDTGDTVEDDDDDDDDDDIPSMFDEDNDADEDEDEDEDNDGDEDEDEDEDNDEDNNVENDVEELQSDIKEDFIKKIHDYYLDKTQNELKTLCKTHNKSYSGNKEVLVSRLLEVDSLRNISV